MTQRSTRISPTSMTSHKESAGPVSVTRALRSEAGIIDNLMQLYTHDFSDFWAGTARGDLNSDGRFEAYPLDEYWTRPNCSALLIRRSQVLAGFALLNDKTHSVETADRNVAEFFILRKHRGQGVGRAAAELVFSSCAGSWEVAVARKNLQAQEFWRNTIQNAGRASNIREVDLQSDTWNGPIFRFDWQ
jgi:predicted acetyltransferase